MSSDGLFFGITFAILSSEKLDDEYANQLRHGLEDRGATYCPLLPNGKITNIREVSHIISTHVEFPEYAASLDANCNVVKPSWVEQSIAKGRQAQARQHSPDPALIFQDVVITCADLPQGDRDAITAGVMALGGMYSSPLTKLVTHIVSLSEEHDKVRIVKEKKLSCSVVLPHWFDDCLKLGRKITEKPYLLPNPEILDHELRMEKPSSDFNAPDLKGATSAVAGVPPGLPQNDGLATQRKHFQAFTDKKVFFSRDLNVHDRLARTLQELVDHGGGTMTEDIDQCDTYIGHYRDGLDYVEASRAGKEVGNLSWFYNVVVQQRWTNPLSKLLHYPVPRNGIPGFEKFRISISNYTGDARLFLENVITEAGAHFTKTMKAENTHLITAHKGSEKCDAAEEWNIDILNHLWVEESYARCEVQSMTNLRYTHFPPRTHLGEIVGQTPIDIDRVREVYFKEDDKTDADQSESDDDNGDQEMKDAPAQPVVHHTHGAVKVPTKKKPLPIVEVNGANDEQDDDDMDGEEKASDEESEVVPKTVKKRASRITDLGTPEVDRRTSGKENEAPPSTGRASKLKAQQQLDKQKADIELFQKEMKRKGGVVHGRKRHSDEASDDGESTDKPSTTQRATKRSKPTTTTSAAAAVPIQFKMMVSGDERWLNNESKEEEDKKTLRSLGIQLTTNPAECTLLCAPRLVRTRKFICALARGPEVVTIDYLTYALTHKALDSTIKHPLKDTDTERKLGLQLDQSLQRARDNKQKLLRGWTIYITEHVNGGFDTYKEIVDINGGLAVPYRGRTGVQLPRRRLKQFEDPEAGLESQNQGGDVETDYVYLVSGTADEEVKLWATFRKMAEKQGLEARIVKTDWLLNSAMAQRVEWDVRWELNERTVPGWKK